MAFGAATTAKQRTRKHRHPFALCTLCRAFFVFALVLTLTLHGHVTGATGDRLVVIYQARPAGDQGVTNEGMAALQQVLALRLGAYGITDANVQVRGSNQIIVDIPNSDNAQRVVAQIGQVGLCEFVGSDARLETGETITTSLGGPPADGAQPDTTTPTIADDTTYPTILQGTDIMDAMVQADRATSPVPTITFTLRDMAAHTFSDYTGAHTGQYISIVVDKRVVSSAMVVDRIDGSMAAVQGIDLDTMHALAAFLRSGPLIISLAVVDTHIAPAPA